MRYNKVKDLKDTDFRRLTGVKKYTFCKMIEILKEAHIKKKAKGCRKNSLEVEDMLLMGLEYLREYLIYFHVAKNYGVAESTAYKTIMWIEDALIKHKDFDKLMCR